MRTDIVCVGVIVVIIIFSIFSWEPPNQTEVIQNIRAMPSSARNGATQAERLSNLIDHFYSDGSQTSIPGVWQGPDLYHLDDGSPVPEMARLTCKLLFLAGFSMQQDSGVAVEFGSWVGQSSSCIAAGLRTADLSKRLFCFDRFVYTDGNDLIGTKWESWPEDKSIRPIFKAIVHRIDQTVVSIKGDMSNLNVSKPTSWGGGAVGLFAIDSAKSYKEIIDQTSHGIWESIQVGGVVVMMDFAKHANQLLSFYTIFIESEALRNEYVAFTASPWAFSVHKKLSINDFKSWPGILKSPNALERLESAKMKIMSDILAAGKKQGAQQADIQATVDLVLGPTKPLSKCIAAIGNKSSDRHFCFS